DLKPSNIMFSADGGRRRPKILDFGIAADTSQISDVRMTRPGQLLGTPLYMAPEQADALAPTPQMDLYALGSVLFHALTGAAPFADEEPFAIVARKRRDPSPSLGSRRDDLPAALVRLVDRCLALDPLERPQSAAAFEAELRGILASPDAPYRERRRAPVRLLSVVGGAVVVALVAGLSLLGASGGSPEATPPASDRALPGGGAATIELAGDAASPHTQAQAQQVQQVQHVEPTTPERPEAAVEPAQADDSDDPGDSDNADDLDDADDVTPPPDPESDAAPAPAPATATPSPVKRTTTPASPRCELVRRAANESRRAYNWADVLRQTAKSSCWSDHDARTELRVKAHLELGDYRQCLKEGDGVADRKVKAMVTICARRIGA
ncbi:MAG: serine/threonine protein kinase, partial [Myxococcales bacterium]|nr:serine/threonine protein kinase [Myxococcales bacterium]